MFERKCYRKLVEWKTRSNGRTALLVEAKSTKTYSTVSLDNFAGRFPRRVGDEFVLHTKQLRAEGRRLYLPLYMAHLL